MAGCKCLPALSLRRLWVPLNVSYDLVLHPVRGCTCHLSRFTLHRVDKEHSLFMLPGYMLIVIAVESVIHVQLLSHLRWSSPKLSVYLRSSQTRNKTRNHHVSFSSRTHCGVVKSGVKREYQDCRGTCFLVPVVTLCITSVFPTCRVYSLLSIFGALHIFSYDPSERAMLSVIN